MSEASAAPRVDLPETEPVHIATPPPAPRNNGNEVKVSVSGPLSQVVNSMGRLNGNGNSNDPPGVHRRNISGVQFLSDLVNNHDCVGYILEIARTGPPSYDGEMLPVGVVDRVQPLTYPELYDRIRQIHGGGDYRVRVMDDRGSCVNQLPFRIDTLVDPPKVKVGGTFMVPGSAIGAAGNINTGPHGYRPIPQTHAAAEEDEVNKLRAEERRIAADISVKTKKREGEIMEKRWRAEEEAELERKEKMQMAPVQQMQNQVQTLERTILAMQQAQAQAQDRMMQNFQQMILAATQKPQDNSMINLIVESGKQQTQLMMTLFSSMMAAPKNDHAAEAAKIQAEANKQIMEMAVRSTQGGNSRYDKLIESLVVQQVNQPKNSVKDALDLMDRGRQQAMEMMDAKKEDDDELEYDPKAGVLGNMGKLIFGLLNGLMKGSGGLQGIATVMSALGKQDTSQVKTSELKNLAVLLEQQMIQQRQALPALPAQPSAGRPAFGPPTTPVPVRRPQPQQPWNNVDVVHPNREVPIRLHPAIEGIYEDDGVLPPAVVQPPVAPMVIEDDEPETIPQGMEERTRYFVTEAMQQALDDVNAGVREHEWSGYALGKWPKAFLDSVVACPDSAARIELIQSKTDVRVFEMLYTKLVDEKAPHNYANFLRALDEVVMEHAAENGFTVAQPV